MSPLPETTVGALMRRYDVFFLDAYGVLVETRGPLPGAAALLERLHEAGKRFVVLSNDASRLPETTVARYAQFGLPVRTEQIVTSGQLLVDCFEREGLVGAPTIVLGTADSKAYVERAGGRVAAFDDEAARVVVVGDDDGYPFLEGIEQVLTTLFHRLDRGRDTRLILPNPDLIYPKGDRAYGLASGSVASVIERALAVRYPARAPTFTGLGKPHVPIFDEARRRTGPGHAVMLGDQLHTDIEGARRYGIDSVLLGTGLTYMQDALEATDAARPTWVLSGLTAE